MATITDIATLIVRLPHQGNCFAPPEVVSDRPEGRTALHRPRIAGTRISVQQIATLHKQRLSATDIVTEYDFLNLAQIYAALAYDYANQAEIEAYIAEDEAEYDRLVAEQSTR